MKSFITWVFLSIFSFVCIYSPAQDVPHPYGGSSPTGGENIQLEDFLWIIIIIIAVFFLVAAIANIRGGKRRR